MVKRFKEVDSNMNGFIEPEEFDQTLSVSKSTQKLDTPNLLDHQSIGDGMGGSRSLRGKTPLIMSKASAQKGM